MKSTCCFFLERISLGLFNYICIFTEKTELKFKKERRCLSAYVNIARIRAHQGVIGRCRRMGTLRVCAEMRGNYSIFICSPYRTVWKTGWADTRSSRRTHRHDKNDGTDNENENRTLVQYAWLLNDDVLRSHTERVHHFIELILMNKVGAYNIRRSRK